MSRSLSRANTGSKNPNFGKHWYKDPCSSKCALLLDGQQPSGWVRGKHLTQHERDSLRRTAKGKVWVCNGKLHTSKLVPKHDAAELVAAGEWRYGKLQKPASSSCSQQPILSKQYASNAMHGKVKCFNPATREVRAFGVGDTVPDGFRKVKPHSKQLADEQAAVAEFNKAQNEALKAQWLERTQAMADYFTKHGYEATCKKFNTTASVEALLMRFIRAREKHGIHFKS